MKKSRIIKLHEIKEDLTEMSKYDIVYHDIGTLVEMFRWHNEDATVYPPLLFEQFVRRTVIFIPLHSVNVSTLTHSKSGTIMKCIVVSPKDFKDSYIYVSTDNIQVAWPKKDKNGRR